MSINTFMPEKDLYLSPKFADFLADRGMLKALVNAYRQFREKENYPFEIENKRIMKQSVFKGLCEFYASQGFDKEISIKDIIRETEEVVEKLFEEKPSVAQEITQEMLVNYKNAKKTAK